jgi:hypothetical protein
MTKETNSTIIAEIIAGTKRKNRQVNVLKVAENLKRLHHQTKSLEKISSIVDLSPEMIRQFIRLTTLLPEVKQLFTEGVLRGVDIGYRISKLQQHDQLALAKQITPKKLTSDDVRNIVKYKIDNPTIDIDLIIDRVLKSKNIKVYVAYFELDDASLSRLKLRYKSKRLANELKKMFQTIIAKEDIFSFSVKKNVITIKVSYDGLLRMRRAAKEFKVPLNQLPIRLLSRTLIK